VEAHLVRDELVQLQLLGKKSATTMHVVIPSGMRSMELSSQILQHLTDGDGVTLSRYFCASMGMSSLGLIPPKSEPVTDRPRMMSNDGTLIGAALPSTPRTTVFPQPCATRFNGGRC